MAETYLNIIDGHDADLPTVVLPDGNGGFYTYTGYKWRAAPTPSTWSYDPMKETSYKMDPTKGRHFSELAKGGTILVSEYHVGKITTHNFLASRPREVRDRSRPRVVYGDACIAQANRDANCVCTWTEQGDSLYWSSTYAIGVYETDYFDEALIQKAVLLTQNAAYSEALSGYDLLTELAEANKTLSFLMGKVKSGADLLSALRDVDPKAWKAGRGLTAKQMLRHSDKAIRFLGKRWLEYRYAIMPLVYSFRDISKIVNSSGNKYKSVRKREVITPSTKLFQSLPSFCLYTKATGTVEVRSFVKQRYDSVGLQNLFESMISLNFASTAWELVPYSFVVDWFLNVGNVVAAQTSINFATQTACTTSIKRTVKVTTYLRDKTYDESILAGYNDSCLKLDPFPYRLQRDIDAPLSVVETVSYDRLPFTKPPLEISFDVSLTWKRMIDAIALSYKPVSKKLRSL